MPKIEIDDNHIYRVEGIVKPSVTQVIESVGLIDNSRCDPYYLDRGKKIHKATELYDNGTLDESLLDPILIPYLNGWKQFLSDTGFKIILIEQSFYVPGYEYVGTIDRLGTFQNLQTLVDIKSGGCEPWHRIQTGGYRFGLNASGTAKCVSRLGVYLSNDGKYRIERHLDAKDDSLFLSALAIYNFKKNGGRR